MSDLVLVYPVDKNSIITQTYADHLKAAARNGWKYYNGGIDWAVSLKTPVVAAFGGKVTLMDQGDDGYGRHVRIDHGNGYLTIYAHLSQFQVSNNSVVKSGDVIGLSGNTGNSTGPHLHFELRRGSKAIDPMPFLSVIDIPMTTNENGLTISGPRFIVTVSALNIRSGPGVEYPKIGSLKMGDIIHSKKIHGQRVWLEFEPGKFVAMIYDGDIYLEEAGSLDE